jgi:septal ring factor EnvC (AmiA/AmiB activator)
MIDKTIKQYKKGNSFRYEININKKDLENLNNDLNVKIISNKEYIQLNNEIKEKTDSNNNLKNKLDQLEQTQNNIKEIITAHENTIQKINNENNQNIKQLNDSYNKKLEKLTSLNQILISGLENLQNLGVIDTGVPVLKIRFKNKEIKKNINKN